MAVSKLQMHVSSLLDKISTKFRRLGLCLRSLDFHWDILEDYATKPELEKSKMVASELQMNVSPPQTRYQRNSNGYTCFFGVQHSIRTHENTMRPNRKWKNSKWRPLNFYCVSLRSQTRYQRNSNGYTYVFLSSIPLELVGMMCDQTGSGKHKMFRKCETV